MTVLRLSALVIVLVTAIGLYKKAWLPEKHCIRAGFFRVLHTPEQSADTTL